MWTHQDLKIFLKKLLIGGKEFPFVSMSRQTNDIDKKNSYKCYGTDYSCVITCWETILLILIVRHPLTTSH